MKRSLFESEHDMFRDSVRKFFQIEVASNLEQWREDGIVDREIFKKAGDQGFLLMWADEAYGGCGVSDFRYDQIFLEEQAYAGAVDVYFGLHSRLVAPYIGHLGSEEQKLRILPKCASGETILGIAMTEPGTGSDLSAMKTKAEDKGDHWLLNGAKTYISNGINGDLFVVAARTNPEKKHGIGLFLVERGMAGFTRGNNLKKMGLKSQDTAELFFDNVVIPKANVLGDPERGFYGLMHHLAEERIICATTSLACAVSALDLTVEYTKDRKAFGQSIASFQNSRFKLADMRCQIDIAQVFVDRCVSELNAGTLSADDAAKAKLFTTELEGRVVDECVQLHGGAGYMDEYRISRLYTDARISRIFAGTSEIMREIIARSMNLDD